MSKGVGSFLRGSVAALGTATFWQGMLLNAGLAVAFGAASALLRKKPKLATSFLDLGVNRSDPVAPLPLLYGSARVGIQRVFVETEPPAKRYLWIIGALAHGPVAGIDEIYLDGNLVIDANGRTSATVDVAGTILSYVGYAHAWKAYGTAGQVSVVEKARGAKTVNATLRISNGSQRIVTTTAHGYLVGDIIEEVSDVPGLVANRGYGVTEIVSSTAFVVAMPEGGATNSAGGGTVDHYTPAIVTGMFGTNWSDNHNGKGVAFVVLRLLYDEARFAGGLPKIEVNVRGIVTRDPRVYTTVSITSSAVGGAVTDLATTAVITTAAVHGLAEGDFVYIRGHSKTELNGRQRVDRVDSTTVFRVHALLSGAGTGGTMEELTYTTNPAVCIHDYLTNPVYGLGAEDAELDEPAFEIEANYHDELVYVPITNDDAFTNRRRVTSATGDGVNVTFTVDTAHDYVASQIVRVTGFSDADNLDGIYTIASLPSSTQVRITLARTGTWTPESFTGYDFSSGALVTKTDAWVAVLTEQARFTCGGVLDVTQSIKGNLEDLLASCRGQLIYQGGVYRPFTRRPVVAHPLVLSEANIIGGWEFVLPGADDVVNIARVTFFKDGVPNVVEYPGVGRRNGFFEDDNYLELRKDLDLRLVNNRPQAQQIAMVSRRESRNPIAVAVTCTEAALALSVGDVVPVTHATPGWALKKFWVAAISCTPDAQVRLVLHEYDETAYDLDAQDDDPFAPDTTLDGPSAIDPITVPTDFAVVAQVVATEVGGIVELSATYTPPESTPFFDHIEYEIRHQRTGDGLTWTTLPITIHAGGKDGNDRIVADWNTTYQITPVTVSEGGTRTLGTGGLVLEVATGNNPAGSPTIGTPVAYANRIEYPVIFDTSTSRIEVWYSQYVGAPADGGTNRYQVGTKLAYDLHRDDGSSQTLSILFTASNDRLVVTFVPFNALDRKGTNIQRGPTAAAAPSVPPDITTTPTEVSDTSTTIDISVTMPGSGLAAGDTIRAYRDGSFWQSFTRTAGVGAAQTVVCTGLNPSTTYSWTFKLRNVGGFDSTNYSPALVSTTDAGTIPTPSVSLGAYDTGLEGMYATITPGGEPSDGVWDIYHSTDGGAFNLDSTNHATTTPFHYHVREVGVAHTCAVKVVGKKSGWTDSAQSAASNTVTVPSDGPEF